MPTTVVLVKHAQPILDPAVPPRQWHLGQEGEEQAERLARALERFMPFALVSSAEPKAVRTAGIVGGTLGLETLTVEGLGEFDRPALPLMTAAEHERVNTAIFEDLSSVVLGRESGAQALARFSAALEAALEAASAARTLVAVTHGTVMALFAAAHNDIDALGLWRRLQCPSYVVFSVPQYRIIRVEEHPLRDAAT